MSLNKIDPIKLSQDLIRCPSVTPLDEGALGVLQEALEGLGFACTSMRFSQSGTPNVDNLYARLGTDAPNLCFAGHTDVVPPGDVDAWDVDPFAAEIRDGQLVGRGAVDMKCAIAVWVAAVSQYLEDTGQPSGSISLLITGDEEGPAINGTQKMLGRLKEMGEQIDACIIGEPTNPNKLGDMIKIGRRGSINFTLTVAGTQGHSAYPQLADNPIPKLLEILLSLIQESLDDGTEHFDPSNLEVTSIDTGNPTSNVIPATVTAKFNIRFNNTHSSDSLAEWVRKNCDSVTSDYNLQVESSGEAFYTPPGELSSIVFNAVKEVTGKEPELSTSGGTSDARYIKDICPVVEFGLINETAHKVNESARVEDIENLTKIYLGIISGYFSL